VFTVVVACHDHLIFKHLYNNKKSLEMTQWMHVMPLSSPCMQPSSCDASILILQAAHFKEAFESEENGIVKRLMEQRDAANSALQVS
jgi:hypothetical protein